MDIFIKKNDYFITNFDDKLLNDLSEYSILELTYHPNNFPSITSYYIMNKEQINLFLYQYDELKYKSINDFFYNDNLSIDNTNYYIYDDYKSNNFNILYNYIKFSSSFGASCDLLTYFYKLLNNDNNKEEKINIQTELEDLDDIYKDTEDISNVLEIYMKMKDKCKLDCINNKQDYCNICIDSINNIKNMCNNNKNIIKDDDIKELLNEINENK